MKTLLKKSVARQFKIAFFGLLTTFLILGILTYSTDKIGSCLLFLCAFLFIIMIYILYENIEVID